MKCPICGSLDTNVKDSRSNSENTITRRRRSCGKCKSRFTTIERLQLREVFVVKRSGIKRPFDREKISKSIYTAVRKRAIMEDKIEEVVTSVIAELENSAVKEIPTRKIGETIMKWLAALDEVAYIRFASVYKDFTSARDFATFISKIKGSSRHD